MSGFKAVNQINIMVSDIVQSRKWYENHIGLTVKHDYDQTVVLQFPEPSPTYVCLIEGPGSFSPERVAGTYPVFEIDEIQADQLKESLVSEGVEVVEGSKGHFKFKDPDGNVLEAYLPGLYEEQRFAGLR
ncbi:VOC family protein [Thalassobacillus hwangdonensis]|uniref:VOC family protein n=1 Tax=Thalassobacillus hwangdonensis TaxID=546108 RepID=A0ABW3L1Y8_9BACI